MKYPLIEGMFKAEDAIPLLSSLYEAKIKFHNQKLLTLHEHNEEGVEQIESKIQDLENNRESIIKMLKNAANEGKMVQIDSQVFLEVLDKTAL